MASGSYRQYVESALAGPGQSPFAQAIDGWILGSERFAERVREWISPSSRQATARKARRKMPLGQDQLLQVVCQVLEVIPSALAAHGSRHPAQAVFAYLGHSATDATLSQLARQLGLSPPDSVPTQIRRVTQSPPQSEVRRQLALVQADALGLNGNGPNQ